MILLGKYESEIQQRIMYKDMKISFIYGTKYDWSLKNEKKEIIP
jgi:hypothetical protein